MKNPCYGIQFYTVDKKIKKIPTDKEIEAVRQMLDEEELRLFDFVKETGARINEALALTDKDITEDYVILYTRKSHNSNRVPRKVPIKFDSDKKGRIFTRWTEQPRFLEKVIRGLGQDQWGWHNLIHRFASRLSKDNVPIF